MRLRQQACSEAAASVQKHRVSVSGGGAASCGAAWASHLQGLAAGSCGRLVASSCAAAEAGTAPRQLLREKPAAQRLREGSRPPSCIIGEFETGRSAYSAHEGPRARQRAHQASGIASAAFQRPERQTRLLTALDVAGDAVEGVQISECSCCCCCCCRSCAAELPSLACAVKTLCQCSSAFQHNSTVDTPQHAARHWRHCLRPADFACRFCASSRRTSAARSAS